MRKLKEYNLPFLGLKIGMHDFDFTLTKSFFEAFEHSEIEESNIVVTLHLEKQASMMILDFHLSGTVNVPCDRCGDQIAHPLVATYRLIAKFGQETGSTDDEVYILGPAEHEIDVSQFLYEYAHLSIPSKRAHAREEDCNQEVLKALEKYRVEESADANWIALKNMEFEDSDPFLDFEEEGDEEE